MPKIVKYAMFAVAIAISLPCLAYGVYLLLTPAPVYTLPAGTILLRSFDARHWYVIKEEESGIFVKSEGFPKELYAFQAVERLESGEIVIRARKSIAPHLMLVMGFLFAIASIGITTVKVK